jgi:hypothetical protein
MSRILDYFGLRSSRDSPPEGDLVSETRELKLSIHRLASEVRDLVSAVQQANDNPNPSRNPIHDMARGQYQGVNKRGHS